jgi:hypothetical protein
MSDTLQLTIRGLDQRTKAILKKKANQQGVSLNRYALEALQLSAGIQNSEKRYFEIKNFLSHHKIVQSDKKAIDDALAWADGTSITKQSKE